MSAFIDQHREALGVEPICAALPIAPSTYFRHKIQRADPTRRAARAQRDEALCVEIRRVWDEQGQVYGSPKAWKPLGRAQIPVARCRVHRLMRAMGLAEAVRGRAWITTTQADTGTARPARAGYFLHPRLTRRGGSQNETC